MIKANNFFFLSAVNGHIVADFFRHDSTTVMKFKHENDSQNSGDVLSLEIVKVGPQRHRIDYAIEYNGKTIQEAKSDPIATAEIYAVIAGLVNEVIPA